MYKIATFLIALAAVGLAPSLAQSQTMCLERAGLLERLESEFSETLAAIALSSDGSLVEVMRSPDGDWTLLVTKPGQLTCIVATGKGWESINSERVPKGEGQGI